MWDIVPADVISKMCAHIDWLIKQDGHQIYQHIDSKQVVKKYLKGRHSLTFGSSPTIPEGFTTYAEGMMDGISIAYTKMGR